MGEPTVRFFNDLAARGERMLPETYNGTLRFDLADRESTDHWYVSMHHGNVTVSREIAMADCVIHANRELFDRMATGEEKWGPLLFRGAYIVEGEVRLLTMFRRLLPGPPGAHHPRDFARSRRQAT
jgi:predicted lipid carrier protein YhbT